MRGTGRDAVVLLDMLLVLTLAGSVECAAVGAFLKAQEGLMSHADQARLRDYFQSMSV